MFCKLTEKVSASPQITVTDVVAAAGHGFALIINNRPDGESDDQVSGQAIASAALAHGIDYVAIPVTHAGFSEQQVRAMASALDRAEGPVLAYCRSGTRSTLLWALAAASLGDDPALIADSAARAGYDVAPVRALMDVLASRYG